MKIGSFIIIVGVIVLLFSYTNFNYQIPSDITNNNLKIISANPFSNSENSPTIFPYTNSTNISVELEYKVGTIVPILKNETISLKIKDLNNSQTSTLSPHVSTSIIYNNNAYDIMIILKASTQFRGFDETEYAFLWNVNLTYNVSGVVYYVYLKNITFYGKFVSVSVLNVGEFLIHSYVKNWNNTVGWTRITTTPLFMNSGEYVIIYNMTSNVNFENAYIKINGHLYTFKQFSGLKYYVILDITTTSNVTLYLQSTNSSSQIYETTLFNVLPLSHDYIGMYIGIGIIIAGILVLLRRKIVDIL
jgi:hypothetical protein